MTPKHGHAFCAPLLRGALAGTLFALLLTHEGSHQRAEAFVWTKASREESLFCNITHFHQFSEATSPSPIPPESPRFSLANPLYPCLSVSLSSQHLLFWLFVSSLSFY